MILGSLIYDLHRKLLIPKKNGQKRHRWDECLMVNKRACVHLCQLCQDICPRVWHQLDCQWWLWNWSLSHLLLWNSRFCVLVWILQQSGRHVRNNTSKLEESWSMLLQSQTVYDLVLFLDFNAYYSFSRTVAEIDNNFLSEDPENMVRKCFKERLPLWTFSRYTQTSYHFYKLKQT